MKKNKEWKTRIEENMDAVVVISVLAVIIIIWLITKFNEGTKNTIQEVSSCKEKVEDFKMNLDLPIVFYSELEDWTCLRSWINEFPRGMTYIIEDADNTPSDYDWDCEYINKWPGTNNCALEWSEKKNQYNMNTI